jgi:RNA polymerase sigma factor (sigma-70 family)
MADASPATQALPLDRGLPRRRLPFQRLQRDERLVALIRAGDVRAFDALFSRYRPRLLAFCRGMVGSTEDAEDVLQEVFASAHRAMLADDREIAVKPWLYRIARNRCLNHLRRPTIEASEELDSEPHQNGTSTADRAERRDELRGLLEAIGDLPETQRSALLLREIEALSYEGIARTLNTTVPAVKSLLVRARMSLAVASQARELSCGEVQLELAEAAEGLRKTSGPVRHHLRHCPQCEAYRAHLRSSTRELGLLVPLGVLGLLALIKRLFGLKASGGSAGAGSAGGAGGSLTATGGGIGLAGTKTIATVAVTTLLGAGASQVPGPTHAPDQRPPDVVNALAAPEAVASVPAQTPPKAGVADRTLPRTHETAQAPRRDADAPAQPAATEPATDEETTTDDTTDTTETPYASDEEPADDGSSDPAESGDTRSPLTRLGFSTPEAVRHWRTIHSTYQSSDDEGATEPPPPPPPDPVDPPDAPPPADDGGSARGGRGPGGEA